MPTSGEHWEADNRHAPRPAFWDLLAPYSGVPTLHFQDYEGLRGFDCPDTSHLDAEDTPRFTRNLALLLADMLAEPVPAERQ